MDKLIIKNLKALRLFLGLTRAQFANAIGAAPSLITLYENAKREPSSGFVAKACLAFHIRPNTLYETDMTENLAERARSEANDA